MASIVNATYLDNTVNREFYHTNTYNYNVITPNRVRRIKLISKKLPAHSLVSINKALGMIYCWKSEG